MKDELGPLPRIHPRHMMVEVAKRAFSDFWIELVQKHDLTIAEQLNILTQELQWHTSWCVNAERNRK